MVVVSEQGQDAAVSTLQGNRPGHTLVHGPAKQNETVRPVPGLAVVMAEHGLDAVILLAVNVPIRDAYVIMMSPLESVIMSVCTLP